MPLTTPKTCQLTAATLLTSVCHTALPQTEVNLYGVVDVGLKYQQIKHDHGQFDSTATRFGLEDGYYKSSRWGLKGIEDLGGDTQALFVLESKFKIYDGSAKDGFKGKAFLGLSNDSWGTLTLGRQKSASKDFQSINTVKDLGKAKQAFGGNGITGDGLLKYISPTINGVQAGISYGIQGTKTRTTQKLQDTDTENYLSVALKYHTGPAVLTASFDRKRGLNHQQQAKPYAVKNWMLSATYDFEQFKLALAYGQDRHGKLNTAGGIKNIAGQLPTVAGQEIIGYYNHQGFKSHNSYVGISAPIGVGKLGLAWSRSSSNMNKVFYNNTGRHLDTQSQNIYAAQYTYPLSKRTTAYAHISYGTGLAYIKGLNSTAAGIGINHKF